MGPQAHSESCSKCGLKRIASLSLGATSRPRSRPDPSLTGSIAIARRRCPFPRHGRWLPIPADHSGVHSARSSAALARDSAMMSAGASRTAGSSCVSPRRQGRGRTWNAWACSRNQAFSPGPIRSSFPPEGASPQSWPSARWRNGPAPTEEDTPWWLQSRDPFGLFERLKGLVAGASLSLPPKPTHTLAVVVRAFRPLGVAAAQRLTWHPRDQAGAQIAVSRCRARS
jgi:hypothetical protein